MQRSLKLELLALLLLSVGCAGENDGNGQASSVKVDLGSDGNAETLALYNDFDASRCGDAQTAVLGFKSFDGGKRNATQDGANELIRANSPHPTAVVDRQAGETAEGLSLDDANVDRSGVDIDVVSIDGKDVCVIRAPVNLNTPAVVRKIAAQGKVVNFYLTGQRSGQGYVEEGATNAIDPSYKYYDKDGNEIAQKNSSKRVDEAAPQGQTVASTFDQGAVANATSIQAAAAPRATNTYICNATNYLLSQQGEVEYLPGVKFAALPHLVRTGFVHVPDNSTAAEVAEVMRETIRADLGSPTRVASN